MDSKSIHRKIGTCSVLGVKISWGVVKTLW